MQTWLALALVVVMGTAAVVDAKPLPADMQVTLDANLKLELTSSRGTVPVIAPDEPRGLETFDHDLAASLSDDGKNLVVTSIGCLLNDDVVVPLARLQARFDNDAGMRLHRKKSYAEAIAHFTTAVREDPDRAVLATNLLCAQSMGNQLDDADKTIATYGPKNIAWFGWRLAVDSDLANVRDRASAKALLPVKPTTLTLTKLGDNIAVSPLGLVAVDEKVFVAWALPHPESIAIYDLKTHRELLRLWVTAEADACPPLEEARPEDVAAPACKKKQVARTAARTREIDSVLQALGFEARKTTWTLADDSDATSADKRFTLAFHDGVATITHGKASVDVPNIDEGRGALGVAGDVTVLKHREPYGCGGADSQQELSAVLRTP